jgi:hypothetical protein
LTPFRGVEVARIRYLTIAEAGRLTNTRIFARWFVPRWKPAADMAARLEMQDFNPDAGTAAIRKSKAATCRLLCDRAHAVVQTEGDGGPSADAHRQ